MTACEGTVMTPKVTRRAIWTTVGALGALAVLALPSIGLFIAPFALLALAIAVIRTRGQGVEGAILGLALVIIILGTVAWIAS